MFAVEPGQFDATRAAVEKAGGKVSSASNAKLGYLRATVPTAAVEALAQKSSVLAIDLDEQIKLTDPNPAAEGKAAASAVAPGPGTPAANPYLPANEIGATAFVDANPQWDGRGVTIGILDSGVDLDHPALATTTTGERKIIDWVTATDPVSEGDGTWLAMDTVVTADPNFERSWQTFTAPAVGEFKFSWFYEYSTTGNNEFNGDVNRDGDVWDQWPVLYRASDHGIWVDIDNDGSFADEPLLKPYREAQQAGHFAPKVPFVVEYRLNVEGMDYVNIGLPAGAHGTHVAGIAAGRGLFGGAMNGAAPGAKIVSSRACTWQGGCTAVALTEGMIDLVVNRGVDVVNMSIGGLPALNDGANARAHLYNTLIDTYGVQIVISAGNSGSGLNTVGDPSVASRVISVGASVSRETWAANYGSDVATPMGIFAFSSRGPREDGGFKPDVVAPGAAISTIPTWLPGEPVDGVGYQLPAGYAMYNGTSMAAPQTAGAAALLLSAAKAKQVDASPAKLRNALFDGARQIRDIPVYAQGNGLINVDAAWKLLVQKGLAGSTYTFEAPVCTPISGYLAKPGRGEGLYDRCGGPIEKFHTVTVTRTSGPAGNLKHKISWVGDDAFSSNPDSVTLPLGVKVELRVKAKPRGNGAHSAIMLVDNPDTPGVDARMMATVVIADDVPAPLYRTIHSGLVAKAGMKSYFVTVPQNAKSLQVRMETVGKVRFTLQHPYGVPQETGCYTNTTTAGCDPNVRSFTDPMPGVWEITIEASRTSPLQVNGFVLTTAVFGASASPDSVALGELKLHQPTEVSWQVTNHFGPAMIAASTSPLASRQTQRPNIANGTQSAYFVDVPIGAKRFEVRIGNPADTAADLDLLVAVNGMVVGQSADGDSEESVVINDPTPGTYVVWVDGYSVPAGSTDFDYTDVIHTASLGTIRTVAAQPQAIGHGQTVKVTGTVTPNGMAPYGRQLLGTLDLTTPAGAVIGQAHVTIAKVTGPPAHVVRMFGQMNPFAAKGSVVAGSKQIDSISVPTRWTAEGGLQPYTGYVGHILSLNNVGDGAGQSDRPDVTYPAVFHADGHVTELPLPGWTGHEIYGRAFAMDDAGKVVGTISTWDPDATQHAFRNDPYVWTASGGYVKLPHLTDDPYLTEPLSINASGTIVGTSTKEGRSVACWWDSTGAIHEIGVIPGDWESALLSVNDSGVAVGESGQKAVVWTATGGLKRLADFGYFSKALAINASGWVIGSADITPYDPHVVVWDPQGNMYDLSALVVGETFWSSDPVGITDAGDFVVYGQALDGSDANTALIRF